MEQKRTLEEIHTLYDLEPDIRDVYVEGWSDKYFIDWYLQRKGLSNVRVYPIDLIDIPYDLLEECHLSVGSNRSKVIALSYELAKQRGSARRVMCIVDRDSDERLDNQIANSHLFFTDGNSLELYALTPNVLSKFLLVALGGFPISVDNLLQKLVGILEVIYSIRQTNERMQLGMQWIPFHSYITVNSLQISFREQDFVRSYLQKNNKWNYLDDFIATKSKIQSDLSPTTSRRIRGHDLAELLHIIVRKLKKNRAFPDPTILEGCLMTSIEATDLESHPLFTTLEKYATN